MRDQRSITIGAPEAGTTSTPPPRRGPTVVDPTPGAGAGAPAGPGATAAMPRTGPPTAARDAMPAAPPEPRRVVVPAPGAAAPATPAPATRRDGDGDGPRRPGGPTTERPGPDEPDQGWRRYLPSRRVVLGIAAVIILLIGSVVLWGYRKFESIETVELSTVLASGNGTNYLIVGSDTREGVDANDPNAAAIIGDDTVGGPERSDTIMILRIDGDGARMLSVPRDLFVTISETGQQSRINSAFNGGPSRLISTLRDQLDLPVHHYLELDFVSFSSIVDALGGITIDFEYPAFDTHSGLNIPEAGPQVLDGTQALAYVRSRYYVEVVDGQERAEGTGDIGRAARQQKFLTAVMSAMSNERNPFTLADIADQLATGMRIDSDLGFLEAVNLLRRMRGLEPEPNSMPTENFRTSAGAAVLRLVQPGANEVLAQFGSSGSRIG